MDNKTCASPLSKLKPGKRRLIQLYTALLYNAQLKGFADGRIYTGTLKNLCVPGLNCYSCPGAVAGCPLGALQNALAASSVRAPTYVLGILMLFGLLLGRTVCGFLCPFGLLQELLHKLPSPKLKKSRVTRALSKLKYVILAVFAVILPLAYALRRVPLPAFCKYICPAGTLEGAIGLLSNRNNGGLLSLLGGLFTRKFVILAAVLVGAVFIYRVFCRFLCPLGALYGLFSRIALIGVKVDADRCVGCGRCVQTCKMDVSHVGDSECIHCGECAACCPTDAISFCVGKKKLDKKEKLPLWKRLLPWAAAICILIAVLIAVNGPSEGVPPDPGPAASDTALYITDFTAPVYGGGAFSTAEQRGKVLVLNFWATWCGPCVQELPHFARLASEYPDTVTVAAIHSSLITEDVDAWLAEQNIPLTFLRDETGSILDAFGGSDVLPVTVIVSPEGMITYCAPGSMTYEKLSSLVEEARR